MSPSCRVATWGHLHECRRTRWREVSTHSATARSTSRSRMRCAPQIQPGLRARCPAAERGSVGGSVRCLPRARFVRPSSLLASARSRRGRARSRRLRAQQPKIRRVAYDRFARRHRERGKAAYLVEAEQTDARPLSTSFSSVLRRRSDVADRLSISGRGGQGPRAAASVLCPTTSRPSWRRRTSLEPGCGHPDDRGDSGPGGIYARIEEPGTGSVGSRKTSRRGCRPSTR